MVSEFYSDTSFLHSAKYNFHMEKNVKSIVESQAIKVNSCHYSWVIYLDQVFAKNVFQPMNSRKTIDTQYTYHNFKVCWKSFDVFDVMQSWWDRQTLVDFHVARDHIARGENSSLKDSIDGWWLMTHFVSLHLITLRNFNKLK